MSAALVALAVAACSPAPGSSGPSDSTDPQASTSTTEAVVLPPSTGATLANVDVEYATCSYDEPWPDAPEDWYRDTPVYVGNDSPTDAVRRFASGIPGFETVWIDRDHSGWVSAGFVGTDIEEVQQMLEAEFPDDGVVAVELFHTRSELEEMAAEIHARLPDGMHAANVHEIYGRIEIYIGLATLENITLAETAAGDAPYCIEGLDPELFDQSPQASEGDGWVFLGVVEGWPPGESEVPQLFADRPGYVGLWESMPFDGSPPAVDFESHIVVAFPVLHSGSCPDQRFDGVIVGADRILPDVADTTIAQACTADGNPRTFLVGVERAILPPPPVRLVSSEHDHLALEITSDLGVPGSVLGPGETAIVEIGRPRVATEMPLYMEPGYPWDLIVSADCDLGYVGEVNGVGWHLAPSSTIPASWAGLAVDDLIDLEITLIEGPEPSLTVAAGGEEALYLPGDKPTPACTP